jgi:hypothetical protein
VVLSSRANDLFLSNAAKNAIATKWKMPWVGAAALAEVASAHIIYSTPRPAP